MSKKLNYERDNTIDPSNLSNEFRTMPSTLYGYREIQAEAGEAYDLKKAALKELRSQKYLEFRQREGKVTEANLDAMLDTDPEIQKALREMLSAKKDLETLDGYVESLRVKKDMLIQMGADARKE